jgi:hypothetical protein
MPGELGGASASSLNQHSDARRTALLRCVDLERRRRRPPWAESKRDDYIGLASWSVVPDALFAPIPVQGHPQS